MRQEELSRLRVWDIQGRQRVMHLRVKCKCDNPVHPGSRAGLAPHRGMAMTGHAADSSDPLFRPVTNNRTGELDRFAAVWKSPRHATLALSYLGYRQIPYNLIYASAPPWMDL